jgi:hypothetical protein
MKYLKDFNKINEAKQYFFLIHSHVKYLKLFEELNRVIVTSEEKIKLRDITRKYISLVKSDKDNIVDKSFITYNIDSLKSLFTRNGSFSIKSDGYKIVDKIAKDLSSKRGLQIIFDRNRNCFTTKNGEALVTINMVTNPSSLGFPKDQSKNDAGTFLGGYKSSIYINFETGHYSDEKKYDLNSSYIKVWDFTSGTIILPILNARKTKDKNNNYVDLFSLIYHEFIHSKDPLCWTPLKNYASPDQIKSGKSGSYGSHGAEIQTMANNLLEIVGYFFERTLRGDTDGGGLNYGLTNHYITKYFIPIISQVRDFINGKRDDIDGWVISQLSGSNKTSKFIEITIRNLNDAKKGNPSEFESVKEWMRDDFIKLIDMFNKKVTDINKKKSSSDKITLLTVLKK